MDKKNIYIVPGFPISTKKIRWSKNVKKRKKMKFKIKLIRVVNTIKGLEENKVVDKDWEDINSIHKTITVIQIAKNIDNQLKNDMKK